jgi:hypothetical protein
MKGESSSLFLSPAEEIAPVETCFFTKQFYIGQLPIILYLQYENKNRIRLRI